MQTPRLMRTIYWDLNIPRMMTTKLLQPLWPGVIWSPLSPTVATEIPEPALPDARWLKIQNRACGIDGTDLSPVFVKVDPPIALAALPIYTRVFLGHESVGTVTEVGSSVTRFRPGDRVIMDRSPMTGLSPNCQSQEIEPPCRFCAQSQFALCENVTAGVGVRGQGGGWSDFYTCHETDAFLCPPDLADDQAVLVEPMSVALHAVLRRPPVETDKVMVLGAGIIGLLTIQAIRAVSPNCFLAVAAKYPHQVEAARRLGANEIVEGDDRYAAVARLTGANYYAAPLNRGMILGGFDLVYDCVGTGDSLTDALRWTRARGAVVLVGIDLRFMKVDLNPVYHQEVDLVGSRGHGMEEWQGQRRPSFDWVLDLIRQGKFRSDGLITHRFPLSAYKQAIATSTARGLTKAIKVVFEMERR